MANRLRACMVDSDEEDEDGNLSEIISKASPAKRKISGKGAVQRNAPKSKKPRGRKSEIQVEVLDCSDTNDSDIQVVLNENTETKKKSDSKENLFKPKTKKEELSITDEENIDDEEDLETFEEDGNLSEINSKASPAKRKISGKGAVLRNAPKSKKKRGRKSKIQVEVLDCTDTNDSDIQVVLNKKTGKKQENDSKENIFKPKTKKEELSITDEENIDDEEDLETLEEDDEIEGSFKEEEEEEEAEGSLNEEDDDESYKEDEQNDIDNDSDEEGSDFDPDFEATKGKSKKKTPLKKRKTSKSTDIEIEENSDDSSSSSDSNGEQSSKNKHKFIRQKTPICDSLVNDCINQINKLASEKESLGVPNKNDNTSETNSQDAISSGLNKKDDNSDSFHAVTVDSNLSKIEKSEDDSSVSDPLLVKVKEETDIKIEVIDDQKDDDMKLFSTDDIPGDSMDHDKNQKHSGKNKKSNQDHSTTNIVSNKTKRMPIKSKEAVDSSKTVNNRQEITPGATQTQVVNESLQGIEVVKKRRGRPPKVNLHSPEIGKKSKPICSTMEGKSVSKSSSNFKTPSPVNNSTSNNAQPATTRKRGRPSTAKSLQLTESVEAPPELTNSMTILESATKLLNTDLTSQEETNEIVSLIATYAIMYQNVFDDTFFQNILPLLSEIIMLCMDEFIELLDRQRKAASLSSDELCQQEIGLAKKSFWTMIATYSEKFFPSFNSVVYKINQVKIKKSLMVALLVFMANTLQNKSPKLKGSFYMMRKVIMCMCKISKQNDIVFREVLLTSDELFNKNLWQSIKMLSILKESDVLSVPDTAFPEVSKSDSLYEIAQSIFSSTTGMDAEISKLRPFDELPLKNKQWSSFKLSEIAVQFLAAMKNKPIRSKKAKQILDFIVSILKESSQEISPVSASREHSDENEVVGLDALLESYLKSSDTTEDLKDEALDVEIDQNNQPVLNHISNQITNVQSLDEVKVEEVDCASLVHFPENLIQSESCNFLMASEQDPLSF